MIFRAHQALLNDVDLYTEVCALIDKNHSAAWAWQQSIEERVTDLKKLDNALLAGRAADFHDVGQRVLLQCWLSCAPRGITPVCPACEAGDYALCWNFLDGRLAPGIHVGNSADATGGFAELVPAHSSMAIPIPDDVTDEVRGFYERMCSAPASWRAGRRWWSRAGVRLAVAPSRPGSPRPG